MELPPSLAPHIQTAQITLLKTFLFKLAFHTTPTTEFWTLLYLRLWVCVYVYNMLSSLKKALYKFNILLLLD